MRASAKRVPDAAAALAARRKAYHCIRKRTNRMRRREYVQRRIPLGSGIAEAARKTPFTQRK